MKPLLLRVALLAGVGFHPLVLHAADLTLGKLKAQQMCQTCHGLDGLAPMAGVPVLSGQKEEYLIEQLKAFRASRRQHAQMSIIAGGLSDTDIENVASWYSNIKVSVELPAVE